MVAQAGDGSELVDLVREHEPELVLVDIRRPPSHTTGATVVMISTHSDADVSDLVAGSGAAGFLSKSDLSAGAIRELLGGAPEARM